MRILLRAGGIACAAIAAYRLCVLPLRCTHVLRLVEARTHAALERSSDKTAMQLAISNLSRLDEATAGCDNDFDFHLLKALNHTIERHNEEALRDLNAALEFEDRPEIYFNRGLILLQLGRIDDAVASLAIATRFNPDLLEQIDGELRVRVAGEAAKPWTNAAPVFRR